MNMKFQNVEVENHMQSKKIKMRATLVREYWADPSHYDGCETPEDMAKLDASGGCLDLLDHEDSVFTVEVAEDQS